MTAKISRYGDGLVRSDPKPKINEVPAPSERIKKAVERNKVKRKVYHILQTIKPKSPHLVIIYPKINTLQAPQLLIKEEIMKGFDTLH